MPCHNNIGPANQVGAPHTHRKNELIAEHAVTPQSLVSNGKENRAPPNRAKYTISQSLREHKREKGEKGEKGEKEGEGEKGRRGRGVYYV